MQDRGKVPNNFFGALQNVKVSSVINIVPRMLALASVFVLAGIGFNSIASAQSSTSTNDSQGRCSVDTHSGTSYSSAIPGVIRLKWDDAPLFINCASPGTEPVRKVLPKPSNGWLPASVVIDGIAFAFLDAAEGHSLKTPASTVLTFYPAIVEDYEAKDAWFQTRRTRVEEQVNARLHELSQDDSHCKFVAACNDEQEDLTAVKAASLADLIRVRDLMGIRNGVLILKTSKRTICLSQFSAEMWRSGDCPPASLSDPSMAPKVEMTRIKVDGKIECLFRVKSDTWESRPCPK